MSDNAKVIQVNPGEGDAFSAVGDVYRVLASGDQPGGVYAPSEIRVSPDNGPPPHIHSYDDEAFFVLEGEITDFKLAPTKYEERPAPLFSDRVGFPTPSRMA